jgi:dipeptidyl aminopeptidase/acylaminoacyl peptidase
MKITSLFILLIAISLNIKAQDSLRTYKKALNHEVYNKWNNIESQRFTENGKWICYINKPEQGDGRLVVYNTETEFIYSIPRGKNPNFANDGQYLTFLIEPQLDSIKALKLKKTPKNDLPTDSLGIYFLEEDSLIKIAKVKSFAMPDSALSYILFTSLEEKTEKPEPVEKKKWWSFKKKDKPEPAKKPIAKPEGENLVLYFPSSGQKIQFEYIDEYQISHDGEQIAMIKNGEEKKNPPTEIKIYNAISKEIKTIFADKGLTKKFSFSYTGQYFSFFHSTDSFEKNKIFNLMMGRKNQPDTIYLISDSTTNFRLANYCPSENRTPFFSKDDTKLFFGIAPTPFQEPKDSILEEDKYKVDIWSHTDDLLQPEQLLRVKNDQQKTLLCVYHLNTKNIIQLEDENLENMRLNQQGDGNIGLASNDKKYRKERSWDGYYADFYIVNLLDGSNELVLEKHQGSPSLSVEGNYLLYFDAENKTWFSYDVEARKHVNLTKDINVNFYDEENDMPTLPGSYGISGWYNGDKYVVINDKFDLWKIDPTGKTAPINLTNNFGRNNHIQFRHQRLVEESKYFNDENPAILYAFNQKTKESGYYKIDPSEITDPEQIIMSHHRYLALRKPINAEMYFWRRMNFNEFPEIFQSDLNFQNIKKISNSNPQQNDYLWGTVELIQWKAFDGQELNGLVYKPENFDTAKKYPMIVYFYEKYADDIHNHYIPKPSHSTINFTEYTSNGYIVFVPDITYKTGQPAQSAYNAIVSGTEYLKQNKWINSKKIGLQGQSWGGYQTAMLITMTDIYACAEAGAPVTNMTSAYGGIRWGSGMSRAFQYEKTQSRIGYTLWDSIQLYIQNSPLFYAPKVKTPLLIMHNDRDGAVPWYQGIEYFSALRRLNKEVWMLTYNYDDHNLMNYANRVDLSIRMMQFFNHYLKDEPMPIWMSQGIPATEKGKKTGYELEKK